MAAQLDDLLDVAPVEAYKPAATGAEVFVRLPASKTQLAVALHNAEEVDLFESIVGTHLPPLNRRGELVEIAATEDITTVEQLEVRLRESGLAVALVLTAAQLAKDDFLRSTGLLQTVTSPALGEYDVVGLPWTLVGVGRRLVTAAPEHA
jgi:crotonobetainyl-CoA:carnitine CoA-transferase CaiB-like acyl-CoA transferase